MSFMMMHLFIIDVVSYDPSKVIKARYQNNTFVFDKDLEPLAVVKHTECICRCKLKASACNPNQVR